MNNLLPSSLHYHWKFDLKGSTYKRRASPAELEKKSPTFKDLDFSIQLADVRSCTCTCVLLATMYMYSTHAVSV